MSVPCYAQTPIPTPAPLQMALSSPFARTPLVAGANAPLSVAARSGKWVPIAVTLSNTGDPVTGQLQLRLASGQGQSFAYAPNTVTVSVDLPTKSNKLVWLYGRVDRAEADGFEVSFSGRGFNTLQGRASFSQPDPEQREVVVVSDTDIGLGGTLRALRSQMLFRNGKAPMNNYAAGLNPVAPFSIPKELIPDRWIGFENADMVVLGDFPHISLSPTQIDALRGYVNGGGTLVVMGGSNTARLSSSPLKDLWPLVLNGSATATSPEVADLVGRYVDNPRNGADRLGGAPVLVSRGALVPDALAPREGTAAQPLFAQREVGAGRVLFLSYDPSQPPFKGWSGQGKLWAELFSQTAKPRALEGVDAEFLSAGYTNFAGGGYSPRPSYNGGNTGPSSLTGQLLSVLSHAEQLTMPPVSKIAWFLALYVFFLVPFNYAILRIIERRELAWVTIPVIVVAFSVWAYSEALSIRGRAILTRQMDVVQSSLGSKVGRVDSLFWLFSPRRATYDVSTGGQNAALCDYATEAGGVQGDFRVTEPLDGSSFKIEGAPVRMWTDRAFSAQSLGDLKSGLTLSNNRLQNGVGIDLFGAVWVQDGQVKALGTLPNGQSVLIPTTTKGAAIYGADITGAIIRASQLDAVFDASARSNGIPQAALAAALGEGVNKPMLLAWGKQSVAPFSIGSQNGQGRQMTLFIFRAPVLPPALASHRVVGQRVAFEPFSSGSNPGQGGYALFNCELPEAKSWTLRAHGIGIRQDYSFLPRYPTRRVAPPVMAAHQGQMVALEVWNTQTKVWQKLPGQMQVDKSPAGNWTFNGPISSAWVRRPDNVLRVRVRLANALAKVSSLEVEA